MPIELMPLTAEETRLNSVTASIELHGAYIYSFLRSLTKNNEHLAQELNSATWLYVLRKFKPEDIQKVSHIRRKALCLYIDSYRARKRRSIIEIQGPPPDIGNCHFGKEPENEAQETALYERFWLDFPFPLTERQRQLLWLSARGGHTLQDISVKMKSPVSTVAEHLAAARALFIHHFNQS